MDGQKLGNNLNAIFGAIAGTTAHKGKIGVCMSTLVLLYTLACDGGWMDFLSCNGAPIGVTGDSGGPLK